MFLCCWRICVVCLALELVGPWVGASFQCRIAGVLMSFYRLMFPGVRSSLVFSGFGLKPPAFGFQSILTVASRLLHLLSKTMGCISGCLMSSASIQKLFCGIFSVFKCSFDEYVVEKVVSPSYSSTILELPPLCFLICFLGWS